MLRKINHEITDQTSTLTFEIWYGGNQTFYLVSTEFPSDMLAEFKVESASMAELCKEAYEMIPGAIGYLKLLRERCQYDKWIEQIVTGEYRP